MRQSPLDSARYDLAIRLLSDALGGPVAVQAVEPLGHDSAAVSRLVFSTSVSGVRSAVVKTVRTDGGTHGGQPFLRREIAAHRLLEMESAGPAVAARLFGYALEEGVMVVEDVPGVTVAEILLGEEPAPATEALCALGSALGQLHSQSVGRGEEYAELLVELGAGEGELKWSGLDPDVDTLTEIERVARSLEFTPPPPAADEYADLLRCVRTEHQVLAHVDSNPGNAIWEPSAQARLVDLESSAWTHAAADVTQLVMPFPFWSAHLSSLPAAVRQEVLDAYRLAMPKTWSSESIIGVALVAPIVRRLARLATIADDSASTGTRWRRRAQMIHQLDVTAVVGSALPRSLESVFPDLCQWLAHFRCEIAARWPEAVGTPIEPFPAYGGTRRSTT